MPKASHLTASKSNIHVEYTRLKSQVLASYNTIRNPVNSNVVK